MTRLSVNVNKVATLRNTRDIGVPSVTKAAGLALEAGADGITIHPRPDQRHIRPDDVVAIADVLTHYPGAELNIEGNPRYDLMKYAREVKPTQCTLVPDQPDAATSDTGWHVGENRAWLSDVIAELKELGCRVSLFMNADSDEISSCADIGADRIELYTEPYARAYRDTGHATEQLELYAHASREASAARLNVNAGHDLNLQNLGPFLKSVPNVAEVSIGHALIADALEYGLTDTVERYLQIVRGVRKS
jgi:pyridoxine 5-phosphate synthase